MPDHRAIPASDTFTRHLCRILLVAGLNIGMSVLSLVPSKISAVFH